MVGAYRDLHDWLEDQYERNEKVPKPAWRRWLPRSNAARPGAAKWLLAILAALNVFALAVLICGLTGSTLTSPGTTLIGISLVSIGVHFALFGARETKRSDHWRSRPRLWPLLLYPIASVAFFVAVVVEFGPGRVG